MNITLKEYFQNNKNRKALVSFPELTDNIKICSQVYHQISLSLNSIWGMPVHADINCLSWAEKRFCNMKILLVCSWMGEATFGNWG